MASHSNVSDEQMREFWDARAREDAFYFVDNTGDYRDADLERFWASGREVLDKVIGVLGVAVSSGDEVVEIGCGVGRTTRELAARAAGVKALDVSEEMLTQAKNLNPGLENVEWLLGDGTSLAGVADRSADACFSFVVFQHIPDPEVTLGYVREMGRVLRPGGWSAFQISNDPRVHRRPSALRKVAQRLGALTGRQPSGQDRPQWLGSAVELDQLRSAAAEAGMSIERTVGEGTQFCLVLLRRG